MHLSKNQVKLIQSLRQKKYRQQHGLFIAEGVKVVNELLQSTLEVTHLYATEDFDSSNYKGELINVSDTELKKISALKAPNKVLGLFKIPNIEIKKAEGLSVVLDTINDPGNLGTIIRLCDWFGVSQLICSKDTVDCYNQKVIQATMGSITRVNICYTDIREFIANSSLPSYAADMDGINVYESELPSEALLIMGNEANGISKEIEEQVSHKITIPRFGKTQKTESLNVATATSILLSEFRRTLK